jgi:methanogen homoisocitrate dehydrogenase
VPSKSIKRIAVAPGDGVGPEVVNSALEVLEAAGADLELIPIEIGMGRWKRTGQALGKEDLELIKSCECLLFGAITTPPDPKYKSVLLRLRKELDLYANIRPFSGDKIDMILVRENTEGLYSGIEDLGQDESKTVRVITRKGSKRIAEKACDLAEKRKKLTIVHKSNVLKSDHLFLNTCIEVADKRGVPHQEMLVDSAAYNLVLRPQIFDVIVTTNLFGDILSDEAAGVLGSLGLCPSANLGEKYAMFEPVHGSAPDITGKGIANPVGAIKSAAMMMDWLGEHDLAKKIEFAANLAIKQGIKTPDLGGEAKTRQVTAAVVKHLTKN